MATTPATPRTSGAIERDDTAVVASDDAFADDTTRRAADARTEASADPSGDDAPMIDAAAGADDEDIAAEASDRGTRRGR